LNATPRPLHPDRSEAKWRDLFFVADKRRPLGYARGDGIRRKSR